ncbi:MAG: hypothetical protein ACI4LX_03210 [Treponema sp.]
MKKLAILFAVLVVSSLFLSCSNPSSSAASNSNGQMTESIAGWYKFVSRPDNYNPETKPVQDISFLQFDETGNLINCYIARQTADNSGILYIYNQYTNPDTDAFVDYLQSCKENLSENKNPGESDFDCFKRGFLKKGVIFFSESETTSYIIRTDNPESKYMIYYPLSAKQVQSARESITKVSLSYTNTHPGSTTVNDPAKLVIALNDDFAILEYKKEQLVAQILEISQIAINNESNAPELKFDFTAMEVDPNKEISGNQYAPAIVIPFMSSVADTFKIVVNATGDDVEVKNYTGDNDKIGHITIEIVE